MQINILRHFEGLPDPRRISSTYPLINIIFISVCAIIAGATCFTDIEDYGHLKKDWLGKYLDVDSGIPSHDTFLRIFALLDSKAFRQAFIEFVQSLSEKDKKVIALDGKSMRGTKGKNAHSALHLLNAYCVENQLCIGQVEMLEKSNEITAAPILLDMLDLEGGIVTADALLCQKDIAKKIRNKKADYVLALKGNQGTLFEDVKLYFQHESSKEEAFKNAHFETLEKGHGRIEERHYVGIDTSAWGMSEGWTDLNSIIQVTAKRTLKGEESTEQRWYISSVPLEQFERSSSATRAHWSIENNLHWQLDISFDEDKWRSKIGNVPANISMINKLALNLIKLDKSRKGSIKRKRFGTALSDDYMETVLFNHANCIR